MTRLMTIARSYAIAHRLTLCAAGLAACAAPSPVPTTSTSIPAPLSAGARRQTTSSEARLHDAMAAVMYDVPVAIANRRVRPR